MMLGTSNQEEDLVRLHKSSISIDNTGTLGIYESYSSSMFTCAQILSLIEATALKKFVVHSSQDSNEETDDQRKAEPLILWVFNPDIYYSCSAYEGNGVLSSATVSEPTKNSKSNDDMPNVHGDKPAASTEARLSPAATLDQDVAERNPNRDDTSAIYGEAVGPQLVLGDLVFEVPVHKQQREKGPEQATNNDVTNSTFGDIPIGSIEETETPLVTSKQTTALGSSPVEASQAPHTTRNGTTQPNDHINLVHRAAKIFYKALPPDQSATSFLDVNTNTHEDLYLPNPADLVSLRDTLEKSTAMLPSSARSFQDWSVGLLNRYESVPSGLGVMQENPLARGISAKDGRVTRWDIGNGAEGLYA